jgi:hypothetical protein
MTTFLLGAAVGATIATAAILAALGAVGARKLGVFLNAFADGLEAVQWGFERRRRAS